MKKYTNISCLGFIAIITTEFGVIGIFPQIAEHYKINIDKAGYLISVFGLFAFLMMTLKGIVEKRSQVLSTCHN